MLSEIRCMTLSPELLSTHTRIHIPASQTSRAGEGTLLAVRKCITFSAQTWASDASSLWVRMQSPHLSSPLFLGSCYIPPAGSAKLIDIPLGARLSALEEHITTASLLGDVLLAGDFNAQVGVHPASHVLHPQSPQMFPAPCGCTDYQVPPHGRRLLGLCSATDTILLNGCISGDF
jgi:hypothetical protein